VQRRIGQQDPEYNIGWQVLLSGEGFLACQWQINHYADNIVDFQVKRRHIVP
jgi:hypothetical protein